MTNTAWITNDDSAGLWGGRLPPDAHRADLAPVFIRLLASRAEARGLAPERLLRGSGLVLADLDAPGLLVSYRQCVEVARRFWRAPPSMREGLEWARLASVVSLGNVGLGMMASANSIDMLRFLVEFRRAAGFLLDLRCGACERVFHLEVQPRFDDPHMEPFLAMHTLASLSSFVRQILGLDFRMLRVELALPRPGTAAEYERFFGTRVEFDAPAHRLVFPDQPCGVRTAEPGVLARMRELLSETAGARVCRDVGAAVAQIIRRSDTAAPPLGQVAAALNLSERSLRRRLSEEGIGYRALVAEEQRRRTLALVRSSSVSMEDVAAQAGYSSARSLRRAVHRWTGGGPSAVRKAAATALPRWTAMAP